MTQSPSPIVDEAAFEAARFAYEAPKNWSRAPSVCLHEAIAAYLAALAPKEAKAEHVGAAEIANEIWEWLFGETKDAVPEELTDELLSKLAEHLLSGYSIARTAGSRPFPGGSNE